MAVSVRAGNDLGLGDRFRGCVLAKALDCTPSAPYSPNPAQLWDPCEELQKKKGVPKPATQPPRYNFEALCMEGSQNISPPVEAHSPVIFYSLHLPRVPKVTLHPNPWSSLPTPDSITPDLHNLKPQTSNQNELQNPMPRP